MGKNLLVINVDIRETRVALIESGIIAELHIERESSKGTLGNIYLGKVSRVLPGMQAAFIDVGLERAAFLHVEDLIRPDDFEAYLAGRSKGTPDEDRSYGPGIQEVATEQASRDGRDGRDGREVDRVPAPLLAAAEEEEADDGDVHVHVHEAPLDDADDEIIVEAGADEGIADDGDEPADAIDDDRDAAFADADRAIEDAPSDEPFDGNGDRDDDGDAGTVEAAAADPGVDEALDEPLPAVTIEDAEQAPEGVESEAAEDDAAEPTEEAAADAPQVDASGEPVPRARKRKSRGRVRRSARTRDRRPPGAEGAPIESAETLEAQAKAASTMAKPPRIAGPGGERPVEGRGRGGPASDARGGSGHRGDARGQDRGRGGRGDARGADRGRNDRGGRGPDGRGRGDRNRPQNNGRGGRDVPRAGRPKQSQEPPRISKTTPIREVVREGQEVMVQVSKEPIGTKGARVTSHISLPGRYVVYLPTVDHIGISKRIGSEKERARLRESIEAMKPPQGGLIVRTLAEGLTKKQLKADVGYLVRLWGEIAKKKESGFRAPVPLYTELDLILKTARDLFTDDIEKIVIDSPEEYQRLRRFVETFLPERADAIELYQGSEPIFDAYGIEDEIQRALARKVPLPSGGYLIIDQAEALTAIDVNTGRFVGKGSKDLEETILATNLEAVEEIAYQLRFRNIGGLIILDLIDMERGSNREKVRRKLEDLLSKDKAKTTLNRISDLGLIEMTRKRTRESLGRTVLEPCFYCDGTGQLQSKQTVAYEILRQMRRERLNLPGYVVIVNAHPAVIDLLKSEERVAVQEAERLFQRRIELIPRKEYHLEQFDLQGR